MNRWYVVGIAGLLFALILACGSSEIADVAVTEPNEDVALEEQTEPEAPERVIGQVGDRLEIADHVAMTVEGVEEVNELSEFQTAAEGNMYVVADILIENIDDEDIPYNPLYFSVKDADGFEYNSSIMTDGRLGSGDLPVEEIARGKVAFEVPAGTTELVMTYEPIVLLNDTRLQFQLK